MRRRGAHRSLGSQRLVTAVLMAADLWPNMLDTSALRDRFVRLIPMPLSLVRLCSGPPGKRRYLPQATPRLVGHLGPVPSMTTGTSPISALAAAVTALSLALCSPSASNK